MTMPEHQHSNRTWMDWDCWSNAQVIIVCSFFLVSIFTFLWTINNILCDFYYIVPLNCGQSLDSNLECESYAYDKRQSISWL